MTGLGRRELLFGILFGRRSPRIAGATFRVIKHGNKRRYFWVHGNEATAGEVLTEHIQQANGTALLTPSQERNIPVLDGKIDPNRLFSREGAAANLKTLNPDWQAAKIEEALDRLDRDRPAFVRLLLPPRGGLLVALHNNGPGYSMNDELAISDRVALNDKQSPDEFMLCTIPSDFDRLAKSPFNVLLQQKAPTTDDGSLSRLAAARGVRYVNIEAAHGNKAAQKRMLEWLERELP